MLITEEPMQLAMTQSNTTNPRRPSPSRRAEATPQPPTTSSRNHRQSPRRSLRGWCWRLPLAAPIVLATRRRPSAATPKGEEPLSPARQGARVRGTATESPLLQVQSSLVCTLGRGGSESDIFIRESVKSNQAGENVLRLVVRCLLLLFCLR